MTPDPPADVFVQAVLDIKTEIGTIRERIAAVETKVNWVLAFAGFVALGFAGALIMSALRSLGIL